MIEHRTDPHGWVVETDRYDSPCTSGYDIRVQMGERYPGPSIAVCIAEGMESEHTHLDADEARHYAARLNEAADILDAFKAGAYVPPPSTYVAPEQTPLQIAMQQRYINGMMKMMNRPSPWMEDQVPPDA